MGQQTSQGSASKVVFRAFLASDGKTPATGKTIAITISKNGGAFGNPNAGATNATEISSGFYKFDLDATDTGTLGPLAWRGANADINDAADVIEVVAAAIDVNVVKWLGTAVSTPTVAGVPNVNAKTWNDLTTVELPLVPTTAGRKLDVSAGGEAGIDWANIGSPTTAVNLSATNIDVDQVVASVSGAVGSVTGAVGSVTGSVGSVTGAVGSVTGNVGGNVTGSVGSVVGAVGSVTGAVGSVTGNVGGNVVGSVGSVTGAVGSVTGNVGGNVVGSVASVVAAVSVTSSIKKNQALAGFTFVLVDSTDHVTGKTGVTVTAQRSIDGAAFGPCANAVVEISAGAYKIDLAAADLNGNSILLKFSGTGADTRFVEIITQP